jgi:hypothetical protein
VLMLWPVSTLASINSWWFREPRKKSFHVSQPLIFTRRRKLTQNTLQFWGRIIHYLTKCKCNESASTKLFYRGYTNWNWYIAPNALQGKSFCTTGSESCAYRMHNSSWSFNNRSSSDCTTNMSGRQAETSYGMEPK